MTPRLILIASAVLIAGSAQADVCSSLQQQYFEARGGNSSSIASPDNVAALNRSLQAAQSAAQANRCYGGFFGFFGGGGPSPSCSAIINEVNRLQNAVRQAYSGSGGIVTYASVSPRDQIRSALVANGCTVPQGSAGGYRTLCVRSCDGYYFPVEYGVAQSRFQANAQTCQAMYGGAGNAQLFVMPSDGDVADATPVSGGKRYGSQPYAFAYRKDFNASCATQLQTTVASLTAQTVPPAAGATATTPRPAAPTTPQPIPQARPVQSEDPETLANTMGNLAPRALAVASAPRVGPTGMRVVGADYYNLILQQQIAGSPATASQ